MCVLAFIQVFNPKLKSVVEVQGLTQPQVQKFSCQSDFSPCKTLFRETLISSKMQKSLSWMDTMLHRIAETKALLTDSAILMLQSLDLVTRASRNNS